MCVQVITYICFLSAHLFSSAHLHVPPPRPAVIGCSGSVISCLVITELISHENSFRAGSHTFLLLILSLRSLKALVSFLFFLTVYWLPPGLEAVGGEGGDHVFNGVADGVSVLVIHVRGVAHKTFFVLLMDRGGTESVKWTFQSKYN